MSSFSYVDELYVSSLWLDFVVIEPQSELQRQPMLEMVRQLNLDLQLIFSEALSNKTRLLRGQTSAATGAAAIPTKGGAGGPSLRYAR